MKERPILFSGPMVRAILDDRKTQTRRVVAERDLVDGHILRLHPARVGLDLAALDDFDRAVIRDCGPYGSPGDRLWVRETWAPRDSEAFFRQEAHELFYRADDERKLPTDGRWRPSIYMPRWASRITLEVTDVRVERLQEITEDDAQAEGVTPFPYNPEGDIWDAAPQDRKFRTAFEYLWCTINGFAEADAIRPGYSWAANPYVWVVSFRRVA